MTGTVAFDRGQRAVAGSGGTRLPMLIAVAAVVALAFGLYAPDQVFDPFLRSDDYPVLLGNWQFYYWKTLSEGRWVNHLWAARGILHDPRLLYLLYVGFWALAWTLTAAGIFRADRGPWRILLAALALSAMPQNAYASAWFATLVPSAAILALYAAIALFGPWRLAVSAMLLFVPLAFMAYTTHPLLILMICAVAADWRGREGWRSVLAMVLVFAAAQLLAILAVYGLNWVYHDHFGIELPDWREPSIARSASGLLENLSTLGAWGAMLAIGMAGNLVAAGPALLLVALAYASVGVAAPGALLRLVAASLVVLLAMVAQQAYTGIETPFRGTGPLWLVLVAPLAMAMRETRRFARHLVFAAGAAAAALWGGHTYLAAYARGLPAYQAATRAIADAIEAHIAADPAASPAATVVVGGTPYALPEGQVLQHAIGFQMRLAVAAGVDVDLCEEIGGEGDVDAEGNLKGFEIDGEFLTWRELKGLGPGCETHAAALAEGPRWPDPGAIETVAPDIVVLRLGLIPLADTPP